MTGPAKGLWLTAGAPNGIRGTDHQHSKQAWDGQLAGAEGGFLEVPS